MAIVQDLVCGHPVDTGAIRTTPATRWRHDGVLYHFCSLRCRNAFLTAPERYLLPGGRGRSGLA